MVDVDGFSTESLRLLLAAQEYPTLALKIEAELTHRRARGEA